MAYGTDRREPTQDPNQANGSPVQAGTVPLGQVMAPRNSSFSGVGKMEEDLATVFAKAGPLMQEYVDKKKPEWRVDGQLAYAQGKTAEEIAKTGNQYTVEGFNGMKATTALQSLYTGKLQALSDGDNQLSAEEYSKRLSQDFAKMNEGITNPYVKNLVAAHAETMLPALLSEQMKANHKWKEEQTFQSFQAMAASTANYANAPGADKSQLTDLLANPEKTSGLNPDLTRKALAGAMRLGLETGNDALKNSIVGTKPVVGTSTISQNDIIAFTIDNIEGNSDVATRDNNGAWVKYGINQKANPDIDVEHLTRAEAIKIYKDRYWAAAGISSLPANMQAAAFDAVVNHGVSGGKKLIAEAKGNPLELSTLRLKEYERLNATGDKQYANLNAWKNRLSKLAAAPVAVTNGTEPNDLVSTLLAKGYKDEDVQSVLIATKQHDEQKKNTFDQQRLANEDRIKQMATIQGNLPAAYAEIDRTMKENHYTPEWGNSMVNDVRQGTAAFEKNAVENAKLNSALSTNSLGVLPQNEQEKALTIARAHDFALVQHAYSTGQFNDEAKKRNASPEQLAQEALQHIHYDRLVANRVVDPVVAKELQQSIRAATLSKDPIQDDKGNLTPAGQNIVNSFGSMYYLKDKSGSDAGFISKFFDGDAKAELLWNQVLSRDKTGKNIPAALSNALAFQNLPEGVKIDQVESNPKKLAGLVKNEIERRLDPSWFSAHIYGNVGAPTSNQMLPVDSNEMKRYLDNPILTQIVKNEANDFKVQHYPDAQDPEAVEYGFSQLEKRGVFLGGSVFQVPDNTTPAKVFNVENTPNPQQAINDGVNLWLNKFGADAFGENWNAMQFTERNITNMNQEYHVIAGEVQAAPLSNLKQNAIDTFRGHPEVSYKYDATKGMLMITPWLNKEHTVPGATVAVPAAQIGTLLKQSIQPGIFQRALSNIKENIKALPDFIDAGGTSSVQ